MPRTDFSEWPCSIARAVDVVGDGWTLLLVREAGLGIRRFEHFQRHLGIGRNILTQRLQHLVDEGVFERVPYQEHPPRHEYRLTRKGHDLWPVLAALMAWGDRWEGDGKGKPVQLHHRSCDHDMHAVVTCSECGEPVRLREVSATIRPDAATFVPGGA
jgi:DNA-binding HxlR family transcriptional regulator